MQHIAVSAAISSTYLQSLLVCWQDPTAVEAGSDQANPEATAKDNPEDLFCFRPIALTSCVGKIYSSILKQRFMLFMTGNGYLDTTMQKAFVEGVPGVLNTYSSYGKQF